MLALAGEPEAPGVAQAATHGIEWLIAHPAADGGWGTPQSASRGVEHGLSLWALAAWQFIHPTDEQASALSAAARCSLDTQRPDGGWAPDLGRNTKPARPATALQIKALDAARQAGFTAPQLSNCLLRASRHLLDFQDRHSGLLDGPVSTWSAAFAWHALGDTDSPALRRAVWAAHKADKQWPRHVEERLLSALFACTAAGPHHPWLAEEWQRNIGEQLAGWRNPKGGWPASKVEPRGGPAYATAMGLLLLQTQTTPASPPGASRPPALLWQVKEPDRAWSLLAVVPIRPEDLLLVPEAALRAVRDSATVFSLTDDRPAIAALQEIGNAGLTLRLLDWNRQVLEARWQLEANWQDDAQPLLRLADAQACLGAVFKELAALPPHSGAWDGARFAALLEEAFSFWRTGQEDLLTELPLRRLPPDLASIWLRHRHAVIAAVLRRLRDPDAIAGRDLLCVPAWYVLGDGGLLDELRWHGCDVTRASASP